MSSFNPFAALVDDKEPEPKSTATEKVPLKNINYVLEQIFGFTLNEANASKNNLLFLKEVSTSLNRTDLDLTILCHALFDRLFMCTDRNEVLDAAKAAFPDSHTSEDQVIVYLFNCYKNTKQFEGLTNDERDKCCSVIIQNVVVAFIQSEIYSTQNLYTEMVNVLLDRQFDMVEMFIKDFCKGILLDDDGGEELLKSKLNEILNYLIAEQITDYNIIRFNYSIFNVLGIFASDETLAESFLDCNFNIIKNGVDFTRTPLGSLFNISILPKTPNAEYEHFQDPTDQTSVASTEGMLWSNIDNLTSRIHSFILSLLTLSPKIKSKTLNWLGHCLKMNADRSKLWNSQQMPELQPANYTMVNDGFMVNFGNVMLRLCQKFCTNFKDGKILKVDPTYCAVPNDQIEQKGIHLKDMKEETCLIPHESEDEPIQTAEKYSFVTECFFLAHRALYLGYQVANDKLVALNHQVGRLERTMADAVAQSAGNNRVLDQLKRRVSQELTKYFSLKAQLADPVLLKFMFNFISSTTYWLNRIAVSATEDEISFPLPETIPNFLKCIPEFIVENIVCYLIFLHRFNPKIFEQEGYEKMKPILTFLLIYMGSPDRLKNPHVRARLAEALESLLPYHKNSPPQFNSFGNFQREMLFTSHEHRTEIVTSLLNVFVGIEMTGQSVEFEQKFNYRRPMYTIMDYLWTKDEYKMSFKLLAEEAEKNMEAMTPPLFLRFINLLMNDAVYLLDETLSNMSKLREMQTARQNGEWDSLPPQERAQNISYMQHIGMIAKFDNLLGKDTIRTIKQLTSEIKIVFTHSTMVDRIASMLNYFLYNLVGPNKKNFKVKDQKEFGFDPAKTVLTICEIYVNLKENDAFCLAISQDGRSYSPQLFELAEDVLVRIGGNTLICELKELANRVVEKAVEQQKNEVAIAEAPEHFLDPIMSTLMMDPVILPSSKQTVDRTTIARHLLSDQTDPFNRAPLSMDQVVANVELAEEIRKWLESRKK